MPETYTFSEFLAIAWPVALRWLPVWIVGAAVTAYFVRWVEGDIIQRTMAAIFWPLFWSIWVLTGVLSPPARWLKERVPEWTARLDRRVSVLVATKVQEDDFGELLQGPLPGGRRATWLRVKDATGTHIIRANPESQSAHDAVARSFGMNADTYHPDAES